MPKHCQAYFLENALKIPHKNDVVVEFTGYSVTDVLSFRYLEMCPYVYENGYRIKQIEVAINSKHFQRSLSKKLRKVFTEIQEMKTWNLQRLCRRAIRKVLGPPLTKKIPELPLPGVLKDYVHVDVKFEEEIP